jgi:hypothetical protein
MANDEMIDYVEHQKRQRSISVKQLSEMQESAQKQISKQQSMIQEQEQELNFTRKKMLEEQKFRELEYSEMQESAQKQISKQQAMIQEQEQELNFTRKKILEEQKSRELEYAEMQKITQYQISQQQEMIRAQEQELNRSRKKIKEEQIALEKEYSQERKNQELYFKERERDLMERESIKESYIKEKAHEIEELRYKLKTEISDKEELLKLAYEELEIEKQKYTEESRKKIESTSQNYVNTALTGLENKEATFHWLSKMWASIGAVAITLGIISIIISTFFGADTFHDSGIFSWSYFMFITFRGLIVVAMFVALARYAFLYSNSYMHESLKNGERRHAINFGKFYLEAYGVNANWEQVKDVFEHWNISNESAFSKRNPSDFDPKIVENAVALSKIFNDKVSSSPATPDTGKA